MANSSLWLFVLLCAHYGAASGDINDDGLTGKELVDYINRKQNLWRAEYNENNEFRIDHVMKKTLQNKPLDSLKSNTPANVDIPKEFDARKKWPFCKSISYIRDQSRCGSCWAISTASAISDRICIASGGKLDVSMSAIDITSCCKGLESDGCNGGEHLAAFQYWTDVGVVTGGNFTTRTGCKPYPFMPCEHRSNVTRFPDCSWIKPYDTPECENKCAAFGDTLKIDYSTLQIKGKKGTARNVTGVENIQIELMEHGPLVVAFNVYQDFRHYKNGIYKHVTGNQTGAHAVKLIGWGEEPSENGEPTPYWLIANSWNTHWGEDGYFRMIRGENNCDIEGYGASALIDEDEIKRFIALNGQGSSFSTYHALSMTFLLSVISVLFA